MIDESVRSELRTKIASRIQEDRGLLDSLRAEIRPYGAQVRRIQPRGVTSIAFVGTDGGNNQLKFDPFLVQLIRVVDSSNNSYAVDVITPESSVDELSIRHYTDPSSELGAMMRALGAAKLWDLSPMIPRPAVRDRNPSWVQVYRELTEWATLLFLISNRTYGSDTLIVFDGLLRSKVFSKALFGDLLQLIKRAIEAQLSKSKRRLWLVGVAKHSKVLDRYQLAMALEGVLRVRYPAYLEINRPLEAKAYLWPEYARGQDKPDGGEVNKFVGGKMFLVKFGAGLDDPIWPVDVFEPQADQASVTLGALLADSTEGFPVPYYPRCLQRAHENAALVDFDYDVLQDEVHRGIRLALGNEERSLDAFLLRASDVSSRRY